MDHNRSFFHHDMACLCSNRILLGKSLLLARLCMCMSHTQTSSVVQEFNVLVACESDDKWKGPGSQEHMTAGRSQNSSGAIHKGLLYSRSTVLCLTHYLNSDKTDSRQSFTYLSGWLCFLTSKLPSTWESGAIRSDCSLRLAFSLAPWLGHLWANSNFTVFVWKVFSWRLFALEHTMSSSWLPWCKSFKGHLFFFFFKFLMTMWQSWKSPD